ncbi:unnamed protein product [Rotaria magnacalcarata]|uniref:Uncharacterized protein n=1 Tax=Rotaria magnacalcarata TaxID=392030 RepID=A0A816NNR0_9BILA|nr:unnamed protein product [Rotaria magnacalcarata]CAF1622734.1 unnamed protein product [Rotaria magnacalcarata]CAF1930005.1 unnamed protein product [Rotaria magnacalcarata]CAF2037699.1 unnamed protein product [Rotaria magnacalcarata]CAF2144361.1 unnamed protein product [Rotaria magnacalcarata]
MSIKSSVRKLPTLSSVHLPISYRRYQNRAAAVYDMSINCHDIDTVCHIHRLSETIILQDWKGNIDYLKNIEENNIQPTLAAIVHYIPFIYIEQAIAEQDIKNALKRFLHEFNPKRKPEKVSKTDNIIQQQLNDGQPILTSFEQYLLVEHFIKSLLIRKFRRLIDIEKCLLEFIQLIIKTNYSSLNNISYLNKAWLKIFLQSAYPRLQSDALSWLNINQL